MVQFLFFLFCFHWLYYAWQTYFSVGPLISILLTILFCGILALHWACVGFVFAHFKKYLRIPNFIFLSFTLVLSFILFDEIIFDFLPLHFGFHFFKGSLSGRFLAPYIGFYGLGILLFIFNLCLTGILLDHKKRGRIIVCLLLVILFGLGSKPIYNPAMERTIRTLGVQGAIPNESKRNDLLASATQMQTMDQYYRLTRQALKDLNFEPDLIIWPETSVPLVWNANAELTPLQIDLLRFLGELKIPLLSGGYVQKESLHNAALLFKDSGFPEYSAKEVLFPLGEYIPLNDFGGLTRNLFPEVPRFGQSEPAHPFSLNSLTFGAPICYEALSSDFLFKRFKSDQLLINLSNDGWFRSELQKSWHAALTFARSLEFGIPVVRVTNDGISGWSSAQGKVNTFPSDQALTFIAEIKIAPKDDTTLYKQIGGWLDRLPRLIAYFYFLMLSLMRHYRRQD